MVLSRNTVSTTVRKKRKKKKQMDREEFMAVVYGLLADDPDNNRANEIIEAADEYAENAAKEALEGKDTNVPTNSALDHIHNVVAEREYQRGYEQAKAEYDHKLTEIRSRIKDHYYNRGKEQEG